MVLLTLLKKRNRKAKPLKNVFKMLVKSLVKKGVLFNPIQDGGGGQKAPPPTSFSPVTSANVGLRPQNILTFSFNPFAIMV